MNAGAAAVVAVLVATSCQSTTPQAPCHGFAVSLASARGGQPSPLAAALRFAAHQDVESLPRSGWQVASRDQSGVTLRSGSWTLHAVQGPDRTWQVDSGTAC